MLSKHDDSLSFIKIKNNKKEEINENKLNEEKKENNEEINKNEDNENKEENNEEINKNEKNENPDMEPINKDLNSNRRITNEEVKDCSALIIEEKESNILNGEKIKINASGMIGGRGLGDGIAIFGCNSNNQLEEEQKKDEETKGAEN